MAKEKPPEPDPPKPEPNPLPSPQPPTPPPAAQPGEGIEALMKKVLSNQEEEKAERASIRADHKAISEKILGKGKPEPVPDPNPGPAAAPTSGGNKIGIFTAIFQPWRLFKREARPTEGQQDQK